MTCRLMTASRCVTDFYQPAPPLRGIHYRPNRIGRYKIFRAKNTKKQAKKMKCALLRTDNTTPYIPGSSEEKVIM